MTGQYKAVERTKGATMLEFALIAFLLLASFLAIIYAALLISFTSGVEHSLQLGLKVAQTNPDQLPDIYSPELDEAGYQVFTQWRDFVLDQSSNSDISTLHRSIYSFREIVMYDDFGNRQHTRNIAMVLPGGLVEIKSADPEHYNDPSKSTWRHHTHVCARHIPPGVDAPCPPGAIVRSSTDSSKELLKEFAIEIIAAPTLKAFPDMKFDEIVAAGYLLRDFMGYPVDDDDGDPGSPGSPGSPGNPDDPGAQPSDPAEPSQPSDPGEPGETPTPTPTPTPSPTPPSCPVACSNPCDPPPGGFPPGHACNSPYCYCPPPTPWPTVDPTPTQTPVPPTPTPEPTPTPGDPGDPGCPQMCYYGCDVNGNCIPMDCGTSPVTGLPTGPATCPNPGQQCINGTCQPPAHCFDGTCGGGPGGGATICAVCTEVVILDP